MNPSQGSTAPMLAATGERSSAGRAQLVADRTRLLLEGPIARTLLRLAVPNVVVMAVQAAVSAGEVYFLGWLGADALAGVSLAFPLLMLMQTMSAGGMGGGVSSAVARALGAGRRNDANALALHALVIAIVMGACFTAAIGPGRSRHLPGHGRDRRRAGRGARVLQHRVRGRDRRLALQHAGQRRPRDREHAAPGERGRRGRGPRAGALAGADLRVGTVFSTRDRGRRRRPRRVLRGRQPRPFRLPAVGPEPRPAVSLRSPAPADSCSGRSCGSERRAS